VWAFPRAIFTKFSKKSVCGRLRNRFGVTIWIDALKGLRGYEFQYMGCIFPIEFSAPLAAKRCEHVLEVQECYGPRTSITVPSSVEFGGRHAPFGGDKSSMFFFVCLSVTLLNDKLCGSSL